MINLEYVRLKINDWDLHLKIMFSLWNCDVPVNEIELNKIQKHHTQRETKTTTQNLNNHISTGYMYIIYTITTTICKMGKRLLPRISLCLHI